MLFPNNFVTTLQLLIGSLVIADRVARSVEFHIPCHFSGDFFSIFQLRNILCIIDQIKKVHIDLKPSQQYLLTFILSKKGVWGSLEGVDPIETDGN